MRSVRRIRALRAALLTVAVLLLLIVAYEVYGHLPRRKAPPPADAPAAATTPGEAIQQSLDKFDYKATEKGRLIYHIIADKLTGVENGLHVLQGIRSADITLSDGRVLHATADHGSFTEGPKDGTSADGGSGHVVLEGRVTVTSDAGERFESDRIEYLQADKALVSPGKCRFRFAITGKSGRPVEPSSGEAGRATYALETKTIAMQDGVTLRLTSEGTPDIDAVSARATIAADGTKADLQGNARVSRGAEFLAAPLIRMERSEDGDRTDVHAATGVTGQILPSTAATKAAPAGVASAPGVPAPTGDARPTAIAAQTLDATEVASTGERSVTLRGEASLVEAPLAGVEGRTLRAREIVVHEGGRGASGSPAKPSTGPGAPRPPRILHAVGGVRAEFPRAAGEAARRVLTCATLDAVTSADGSLATADADGSVTISAGARRSTAAHAHMIGETRVELRGSRPAVEEPDRHVVADEIDIVTKPSQLTARGKVQTRFVPSAHGSSPRAEGPGSAPADGTGLPFTPGVPVDVLSDAAVMKQDDKTAEFTGHVRARQAERALSSAKLLVNDADKTARAEGSVSVRTFREEKTPTAGASAARAVVAAEARVPAPAVTGVSTPGAHATGTPPAGAPATASATTKAPSAAPGSTAGVVRVPVQIDADSLFHDDVHHLTRFEGHAIYREPSRRLNADRITLEGGSGGAPATTIAEGHVVTEGDGKHGTGDRAVHRAADKTVTLEGHDRPAQVLEPATGRSWRGPSLTWVQAPDSIPVVTGTSGRSRIVGSTGSQRDGVGKPTDRGKPR